MIVIVFRRSSASWSGRWPARTIVSFLLAGGLASPGCSTPVLPYAAESNQTYADDDQLARRILTTEEQAEADATLRSVAAGQSIVDPRRPAEGGLRWSDVPVAVEKACDEVGMAVYGTVRQDNRFVFELRTTDERPARLIVTRRDDARLYDTEASAGWFGDDHDAARRLISAFDAAMIAEGRKPKYDDDPGD